MSAPDYASARRHLMRRDPVLGAVVKRLGPCGLSRSQHTDHLTSLIVAIANQQLSGKAAATIFGRFLALFPEKRIPSAAAIDQIDDDAIRGAGFSRPKVSYLRDLCAHIADGRLQLDTLARLQDEEVIEQITSVKGLGRWSAEMFLMFRLNRPDVLPVADLGIATAIQRVYRLRKRPDAKRILAIGEPWKPYRSVACWYLWQSLQQDEL